MIIRFLFIVLLLFVGWTDFRTRRIPDRLALCLFVLGVFAAGAELGGVVSGGSGTGDSSFREACAALLPGRIAGLFAASLPLFIINLIRPGAFGGGDIKLLAAGGLFLGAAGILRALGIGMALAGLFCVIGLLSGRVEKKSRFALGPFLCAGMIVCCFLM